MLRWLRSWKNSAFDGADMGDIVGAIEVFVDGYSRNAPKADEVGVKEHGSYNRVIPGKGIALFESFLKLEKLRPDLFVNKSGEPRRLDQAVRAGSMKMPSVKLDEPMMGAPAFASEQDSENIWAYPEQLYDSADTSINEKKRPAGYNTLKKTR